MIRPETLEQLVVPITARERDYLRKMMESGLYGHTIEDAAERLIGIGIKRAISDHVVDFIMPVKK